MGPHVATGTESTDQVIAELEQGIESQPTQEQVQPALRSDLLGALLPDAEPSAEHESERFDISVQDVPSDRFFQSLVADTPYNMVVHPNVNGSVSLQLKNVTVDEVMTVMRDVYGYDYVKTGNLYRVYPDVLRTEVFQVNYLNVSRTGHSEMQVSAGKVTDVQQNNSGSGYNDDNSGAYSSSGGGQDSAGVVGTIVNTDADADLWAELQLTLETLVGPDEGQVVVTPQVGLVVVRAKPDVLFAVREYLKQVQSTLHRQVILEAKILEVTLNDGFQAGINWNTFGDASGGTFKPVTSVDANGNLVTTAGSEHSVAGSLDAGSTTDIFNPLGSSFRLNAMFGDFEAAIDLLETQGSVQVLSSPRIATVNNQKAVIKVGSDEFFVTDISTNTVTAGSAINTNDSPELTPFFSGIALDVTPQISDEGEVTLHIHPTVSEVQEQQKLISGEVVPLAASTIRESDSIVRARDGQVIVIGGLMQTSEKDNGASVPGLGRIPLLGYVFKQKTRDVKKSELVILLKPIVVDSNSERMALQRSLDHVESLKQALKRRG